MEFEIQLIAILAASSCAIPGCFLMLRKMSMMADSITHTILLGIVLGFFITGSLQSPLLIFGAGLMGIFTVWLTETVQRTKLVSEDASIGIIFPLLFSIAVLLISKYAGNAHLDTDSVLLGELAFAPFERAVIFGKDIGPKSAYISGFMLLINILFTGIFFKELKLSSFDSIMALTTGFSPVILYYGLMTITSLTAVVAFETAGSILVVAFMTAPPITAYLLTNDLKEMIIISVITGILSSTGGYNLARLLDISIAGSIACVMGIIFFTVFLFAPEYGLLTNYTLQKKKRTAVIQKLILIQIFDHTDFSVGLNELYDIFVCERKSLIKKSLALLEKEDLIKPCSHTVFLTEKGIQKAENFTLLSGSSLQ